LVDLGFGSTRPVLSDPLIAVIADFPGDLVDGIP